MNMLSGSPQSASPSSGPQTPKYGQLQSTAERKIEMNSARRQSYISPEHLKAARLGKSSISRSHTDIANLSKLAMSTTAGSSSGAGSKGQTNDASSASSAVYSPANVEITIHGTGSTDQLDDSEPSSEDSSSDDDIKTVGEFALVY
jgi:hypothetical protein